jgi:hypothetical protein
MSKTYVHKAGAPWPDLKQKRVFIVNDNLQIARQPHGMRSGKSSVSIRIDLPHERVVVAKLSMDHFLLAAGVFRQEELRSAPQPQRQPPPPRPQELPLAEPSPNPYARHWNGSGRPRPRPQSARPNGRAWAQRSWH